MSVIMAEELRAGLILGDRDNDQYLYMPGSEIGSDDPVCIFEDTGTKPICTWPKPWNWPNA